jgi:hypothetical protein
MPLRAVALSCAVTVALTSRSTDTRGADELADSAVALSAEPLSFLRPRSSR